MLNARKIAVALQKIRDGYTTVDGVTLIDWGTVITDNAETTDLEAPYTDDDNVRLTYQNGERYLIEIVKID